MKTAQLPTVQVLLAAHNGMAYIATQVESILAQTGVHVHLVLSVDCSSDGTEAWATSLAAREPRVALLAVGQRFGGAAPNFLRLLREIELTGFDALAFADQDDHWYPDKLSRALSELARTGAAGYSSNVVAFWESGRKLKVDKAQPQRDYDYLFEAAGPGCTYVLTPELAFAAQALAREQAVLLTGLAYHDWMIYALARARGGLWVIDPESHMLYRQHASNQVGVNVGWAAIGRRLPQVLDGEALVQAQIVARAVGAWDSAFVRRALRSGRKGLFWLALNAERCRRRPRDRWLFALSCVVMACRFPSQWGRS